MAKTNRGKSICLFSTKGGVGKTMTALNLAGIFSRLEKKVLLIDFDTTSGGIATYLNVEPNQNIYNFADDYLNNRYQNITNYVTKYNEYISFLSSPKDPRQGSKIATNYIEIVIEKAVHEFDYVFVDMPHTLSEFNITILDTVDEILLMLTNDLLDIRNMRNLVKIFSDAEKTNFKIILNASIHPNKKYYSLYDIKNIIKANIDYFIPSSFFIKSIDNYVVEGKILTLEAKMPKNCPEADKTFITICQDLMEDSDE